MPDSNRCWIKVGGNMTELEQLAMDKRRTHSGLSTLIRRIDVGLPRFAADRPGIGISNASTAGSRHDANAPS